MESGSAAPRTIAVYGGSFDPPHVGHVLVPTWVMSMHEVDRVIVCPCHTHVLDKRLTPFERRVAWTRAAMAVHGDRVEVSELERTLSTRASADGPPPGSTLSLLEAVAALHPQARVRLVVGSDIIDSGETRRWHRWEDIAANYDPIVVPRAGMDRTGPVLPEVSSSAIRAGLERGGVAAQESLDALVPAAVRPLLRPQTSRVTMVIIGEGNVGTHARPWLTSLGYEVRSVSARALMEAPAVAGIWRETPVEGAWVRCRDAQLPAVAKALVESGWPASAPIVHGAGALPSEDPEGLGVCAAAGIPVGTLHPVQALRGALSRDGLGVCHFGVEGHARARQLVDRLVPQARQLDLTGLTRSERQRYHAGCALVANHLGVLLKLGAESLSSLGLPTNQATAALSSLLQSSEETLRRLGFPAGVTGPAARGDLETVARHLDALDPMTRSVYETLSTALTSLLQDPTHGGDPGESSPAPD